MKKIQWNHFPLTSWNKLKYRTVYIQPGFETGVGINTTYWTQLITTDKFDS